jgi:hypothetical protein
MIIMDDADQIPPPDHDRDGSPKSVPRFRGAWLSGTFKRPFVVTARVLLFALTKGWTKLWRKRPGSKPPHWAKDLLDIFSWINLVPTFFVMVLAPRHFFQRTSQIRRFGSRLYKTPIKFLISAVPFVIGLHWLPVAWLYRDGVELFLSASLYVATRAWLSDWCCEHSLYGLVRLIETALRWSHKATDTQTVSGVLLGIPIWVPLVSCFVALVLLVLRLFKLVKTRTILPLLISADPRMYVRIRWQAYLWNLLYFAVYFVLAFPICLIALYGIFHEFWLPTVSIMRIGPLRLWWMATQSALAVSIITTPYNELLQASVVVPTPLMLTIRLSKIQELLEGMPFNIKVAQTGNVSALERAIDSCNDECLKLRSMNTRLKISASKAGDRWERKLAADMKKAFSTVRIYSLSQTEPFPLSPLCKAQVAFVSDFLSRHGASDLPEPVPPKRHFFWFVRRLLILFGIALLISAIILLPIWWFAWK